jgi:acyl-CoA thioester hydrolase
MTSGNPEFRVYYEDTDAGGVVYHATYLGFLERGRCEFIRARDRSVAELARQGVVFPVARLEIDYRAPAVLDDLLRVETVVLEVGRTSFTMAQQVVRVADGKPLVTARVTLVCVGPGFKARRLPLELREALGAALVPAAVNGGMPRIAASEGGAPLCP